MKATCSLPDGSGCGDVKVDISQVTLRYLEKTAYEGAQYRFRCPKCKKIVLKDTSPEVANTLYSAGAIVERYEISIEVLERPNSSVTPISLDDIIDLHQDMEQPDWINKLKWKGEL